ncbi:MAG: O-antigen ligase family protein [Nitrospirota bacterium]
MLWLVIGYMFLFVFRPFEYWPVLGTYRIERVYMIALLVVLFLWQGKRHLTHSINNSILFFLGVMVVSSVWAFSTDDAYQATFDYFKLVVFYFVIVLTIRDERQLKIFMVAYIAVLFLYVGKSAWEFFVHGRYVYNMGIKRMPGLDTTYGDPNAFAASIAYSLPFLWALIKYRFEQPLIRKMLWAYALLAGVCIIATGSRSGMVTSLLFLLLVFFSTSRKVTGVTLLLALLAFVWNVMPLDYQQRFKSAFFRGVAPQAQAADASAQGRLESLKQGIKMFMESPLLGIGPGNFKYGWDHAPVGPSAHNLYGELLGETGVMGLLVFSALVILIVRTHRTIIERATLFLTVHAANAPPASVDNMRLLRLLSSASVQVVVLLLFNGNFGRNLYRYNWLWIGAIAVLSFHFLNQELKRSGAIAGLKARRS